MQNVSLIPNIEELNEMSRMEITDIDRMSLVDITTIRIDQTLPIETRMQQYLKQIRNPYCFLCGGTPVRVRFSETEKTLDDAVKCHYLSLKKLD